MTITRMYDARVLCRFDAMDCIGAAGSLCVNWQWLAKGLPCDLLADLARQRLAAALTLVAFKGARLSWEYQHPRPVPAAKIETIAAAKNAYGVLLPFRSSPLGFWV